ncbi:MAG: amidohydrolase family protein [Dehalococcoidia bacterium]
MIIDSHCHAWAHWPYLPAVHDPETHGAVEHLLNRMDLNGIDRATIVCAQIWRNTDNNDYVAAAVRRHPGRLCQYADVDSVWSETYHLPGAAKRLEQAAERWPIKGFTHYLAGEDDGAWLTSSEGSDFFRAASDLKLIASIACRPQHQPALRKVAEKFPDVPILCHHMSGLRAAEPAPHPDLQNVLESAALPNIYLKLSGFAYLTDQSRNWDFPYSDTRWIYEACFEKFGTRMCWGSDFPPVHFYMTYRQSLETFRTYCEFVPDDAKEEILGGTLSGLLEHARDVEV